jgi:hypothetical protein
MLEVLKSRYITGLSASSWRKARPFAAPSAIFILMDHGRGRDPAYKTSDTRENQTRCNLKAEYYQKAATVNKPTLSHFTVNASRGSVE